MQEKNVENPYEPLPLIFEAADPNDQLQRLVAYAQNLANCIRYMAQGFQDVQDRLDKLEAQVGDKCTTSAVNVDKNSEQDNM